MNPLDEIRAALNPNLPDPPLDDWDWEGCTADLLAAVEAVLHRTQYKMLITEDPVSDDWVDGYRRAMDDVAATIEAALAEEGKP